MEPIVVQHWKERLRDGDYCSSQLEPIGFGDREERLDWAYQDGDWPWSSQTTES